VVSFQNLLQRKKPTAPNYPKPQTQQQDSYNPQHDSYNEGHEMPQNTYYNNNQQYMEQNNQNEYLAPSFGHQQNTQQNNDSWD